MKRKKLDPNNIIISPNGIWYLNKGYPEINKKHIKEAKKEWEHYKYQIPLCIEWIKKWCEKSRIYTLSSSYHYKHVVEKDIGKYICNGAFIQAAISLGYKIASYGNLNAHFGMKVLYIEDENETYA